MPLYMHGVGKARARARTSARALTLAALLAAGASAVADTGGMRSWRALAMAPGGERIAAVEAVENEARMGPRVVVRDTATGRIASTWQHAECPQCRVDSLAWSPDGRQVAFLATVGAKKLTGAVEAGARQVGEIGLAQEEDEQRIAVVPAAGGSYRLVSPGDTFVYEYDWMPDGRGFVVTSARGNGDNNWWIATLGHVDAASGRLRVIAAPAMQINMPHVSPDGRTVAFIGGLMSDFGSVGGDVYTVPIEGGEPVDATAGVKASFNGIAWRGQALLASVQAGADTGVATVDPAARTTRMLWQMPVGAAADRDGRFVFSADGRMAAAVTEDFEHAPRLVAGRLPELVPITHDNDGFAPQVAARSITWTSEGFGVQGWLVGPRSVEPGRKYPMLVQVHGGPAATMTPRYVSVGESGNPLVRELANAGYFVFMPNPRGSFGQGAEFTRANRRDFGGGDWRDILAGVDAAIAQAPIDGDRLGLMGHSYGGFMTMWGVTHSGRFKAAVAGAGIANWISYYGQNGIDQWMVPYFGATMYDDPAAYRAASPIESIKAARTPTLVYVGERDVECPPAQSFEFWHGLRALGVPTSLVVYEGEGHALRKPEHQRDLRARVLGWFDKYLK